LLQPASSSAASAGSVSRLIAAKGRMPLFEKSGAKTSANLGRVGFTATAQINKVFLLLFVHKK
jgi:hypothetical protein